MRFYHGWKFAPDGACIEQPAEENAFCHKVSITAYPRANLGLVFAFLGSGAPPALPLHPEFEKFDGVVEVDSYSRDCNYFQNLENALDMSHIGFVHADNAAVFKGVGLGRSLDAEESTWGVTYGFTRHAWAEVANSACPAFYLTALPTDPDIGWQESMFWWVPIDDLRTCSSACIACRRRARPPRSRTPAARRGAARSRSPTRTWRVSSKAAPARRVDKRKVDLVRLQDDVAQVGQGDRRPRRARAWPRRYRRDRHPPLVARERPFLKAGRPREWARRLDRAARLGLAGNPARIGGAGPGRGRPR